MKRILLLTAICFAIVAAAFNNNIKSTFILNGTWAPIKQEIGGKALPSVVYETQKLVIADSSYQLTAESIDKGILKYKDGKMDIYGKEGVNAGKHFTAIYKIDNEQLTICYNLKGDDYPANFETKTGSAFFLAVFKKL
jgi:uncharacterized protein (TIGR03067 family)